MAIATPIIAKLSGAGLAVAAILAVVNVLMEVARKKAVTGKTLVPATFWCHVFDTLVFVAAWVCHRWRGYGSFIRGGGDFLGISGLHLSSLQIFVGYELIDFLVIGLATWMFFKALQAAAMSTGVPFLAFTPVLVIPTGFLFLGELPSLAKLVGVLLVTLGSVVMHWRLFAVGWLAPVAAIYRNKGSRYMLFTALLLAVTTPLDKKLSLMADAYTQSVIFGVGMCVFFLFMAVARREPLMPALANNLKWIALAGILDGATVLLQFTAYQYIDAVIVISIKRSGIVLAVIFGWLFFREGNIRDKLMASSLMFVGMLVLYLPLTIMQAIIITAVSILLMGVYMALAPPGPQADPACENG
jgi:uncharacterized membrane protein